MNNQLQLFGDAAPPDPAMQEDLVTRMRLANIDNIAEACLTWADSAFPTRTDASMFLKMYGELAELIDAGKDCGDEVADILILVLDYARRKGVKPSAAVLAKLNVNRQREWEFTNIGTMQHVKTP
jgi:hypothetical protein